MRSYDIVSHPELRAIAFGLLSAISFGAGDFCGGLATRRSPVAIVIAISHGIGLLLLVTVAVVSGEVAPRRLDLLWGAGAGLAALTGLAALYRGLATGRAGMVAPVAGVVGVMLPVAVAFVRTGLPSAAQLIGFGVGLLALWLVSGADRSGTRSTIGLALIAGIGFGFFFVLIGQVQSRGVFWPLAAARATSFLVTLVVMQRPRDSVRLASVPIGAVVLAGALDVSGNVFFLLSSQSGRLDIAAVVSSLYPAMTILLARLILKERLGGLQVLGIVAALVAIGLIAGG